MDLRLASSDRTRPGRPAGLGDVKDLDGDLAPQPHGICHGYLAGSVKTLCGRPLSELYPWPGMQWPDQVPDGTACYACDVVQQSA